MLAKPDRTWPAPRADLTVERAMNPDIHWYRRLYHGVGDPYRWRSRGSLSDADLARSLGDPGNEVFVLRVAGVEAGFSELDRRRPEEIELVQFGLLPSFIGQGLGKYLLGWTIEEVWRQTPRRFWLHTCSQDHPAALPNYLAAGFRVYRQESIVEEY